MQRVQPAVIDECRLGALQAVDHFAVGRLHSSHSDFGNVFSPIPVLTEAPAFPDDAFMVRTPCEFLSLLEEVEYFRRSCVYEMSLVNLAFHSWSLLPV